MFFHLVSSSYQVLVIGPVQCKCKGHAVMYFGGDLWGRLLVRCVLKSVAATEEKSSKNYQKSTLTLVSLIGFHFGLKSIFKLSYLQLPSKAPKDILSVVYWLFLQLNLKLKKTDFAVASLNFPSAYSWPFPTYFIAQYCIYFTCCMHIC